MHNWKNFNDNEHVFVNQRLMNYGVIKDDSTFSRTGKSLWIAIPVILTAVVVIFSVALTQEWWMGLISLLPCLTIYQWILRKFVFEENRKRELMRESSQHRESGLDYFNNVLGADDDGQIFFQQSDYGFSSGYLVTFSHGSITESTENAEKELQEIAFRPFLRNLQDNGFRFVHYDIAMKQRLSKGTLNLIEQTKQMKDNTILKVVSQLQNEACASLERSNNVEYRQFWLVLNDSMNSVQNFRESLQGVINATLANAPQISSPHICTLDEVNDFGKNYFEIASFDINNINRNIGKINLGAYFIIDGFIDQNGLIHKPSELHFFPTDDERISKRFNKKGLHQEFKKRKNQEINTKKKKEFTQRQDKLRRSGSRDLTAILNKLQQQNDLSKQKEQQQKQLEKKQRDMKNKQRMQQNRAKNFNDLLNQTRNKQ